MLVHRGWYPVCVSGQSYGPEAALVDYALAKDEPLILKCFISVSQCCIVFGTICSHSLILFYCPIFMLRHWKAVKRFVSSHLVGCERTRI